MNKYYTPEIEEFYVGFEFEMKVIFHNPNNRDESEEIIKEEVFMPCVWKSFANMKDVFNIEYDSLGNVDNITVPDSVRVKTLDREDIESLGFKQGKLPYQYFSDLLRIIKLEKENLYSINANVDDHCLFYGTIKNKSELKKVLKMLGI